MCIEKASKRGPIIASGKSSITGLRLESSGRGRSLLPALAPVQEPGQERQEQGAPGQGEQGDGFAGSGFGDVHRVGAKAAAFGFGVDETRKGGDEPWKKFVSNNIA